MIVEIEKVSKKFLINHQSSGAFPSSLKEVLTHKLKSGFRRLCGNKINYSEEIVEEFWALQDINLKIEEGDKIALLGRNGAGKSTLLKIISRITEPTKGRIKIKGRVSSVLEVGTGFHPELTGRENIFLNGAVMGMSYSEMKMKFDEIVDFAGVEQFLDTPVKRYSSGMYTRLGFAIAAHLDADLLIVDEVLAVGDAQFQQKCLNKMNDIGTQGCTVLFVSHNVSSVLALCNKGVFLEKGKIIAYEPIDQCVNRYMKNSPAAGFEWRGPFGDEHVSFKKVSLMAPGEGKTYFETKEKTQLVIDYDVFLGNRDLLIGFSVLNSKHQLIAASRIGDHEVHYPLLRKEGTHQVSFDFDFDLFHPGEYYIRVDSCIKSKKRILNDEILLKFAIYSNNQADVSEVDREGISLGNKWKF